MVYWSLLNIHPAYRSTTRAIQLLATVNSKILKTYGFDSILKPAVNELERLSKVITQHCIVRRHSYVIHNSTSLFIVGNLTALQWTGDYIHG